LQKNSKQNFPSFNTQIDCMLLQFFKAAVVSLLCPHLWQAHRGKCISMTSENHTVYPDHEQTLISKLVT